MNRYIKYILIIGLFLFKANTVLADNIAGQSANITSINMVGNIAQGEMTENTIKMTMRTVLQRYNSPMVESIDAFYNTCKKYNLDCYLLPSIAGIESTFGRFTYPGSNNPFGWGRGLIMFKNWEESIDTVGRGLRENYMDKWKAYTVDEIGPIYCEGNTWASKVNFFMKQFKDEEAKIQLFLKTNPVQL